MLNFIAENIPGELKQLPQWVVWQARPKPNGKADKIPFDPITRAPASSTKPATWGSFRQAVAAAKNGGGYSGIGFVLNGSDLTGVDLDSCIDANGEIEPWALEIVNKLNSYTEISPSGKGLRIFLRGKLNNPGRRKGPIEVYNTGRFLTATGHQVAGTPNAIMDRYAELDDFHKTYIAKPKQAPTERPTPSVVDLDDKDLLSKALKAKNGALFSRLFSGDWAGYPSQSEADQALCNLLAFWTGRDPEQMERLFRQSGLYREKCEKHPTYLVNTIRKAVDDCREVYTAGKTSAVEDFSGFELNWDGTIASDEERPNSEETAGAQNSNKQPAIITNNRFLGEITGQALKALAASNYPEVLFTRGGTIVKVSKVQEKDRQNRSFTRPVIKSISESSLRGFLARSAQYVNAREKNGETKYYPTSPPLDLVRDVMSLDSLPLPLLCGIVQAPVMRYDGSMFTKPGYDTVTSLYYSPEPGFSLPYISDAPTNIDIKNALGRLFDVIIDFPFDSEASWTNILAAIMTPVLRDLIGGPVPLLLIDKPLQGTGASLLSDVISIIATGEHSHMTTAPEGRNREEEWRKRVTAILGEGRPITVIDNVEEVFRSATLCALLTSTNWSDRLLGRNELVNLQHRTCWIATGNNIRLAGDLPRRCYKVRLDANRARPWQRGTDSFRHPHLIQHVKAHRGELLASIYTIARAWILAGRPPAVAAPVMGSFEEWREVIGGMLEYAGVNGFLGNTAEIYESAEVNEGIEDLIELWFKELGEKQITAKQIQRFITWESKWQDVLPDWLDPHEQGFTRKLGRVLARKAGVYFTNGYKLEKCGVAHQAQLWKVRSVGGV